MRYKVTFNFNTPLIERIRNLDKEYRSFNSNGNYWEIHAKGLYLILTQYKKSDKIHFDFGGEEPKREFVGIIKKLAKEEEEKKAKIAALQKKNEEAKKFKVELEEKYKFYEDKAHANLKDFVQLYPYQTVAAIFLDFIRSGGLFMEMGLGKTLSSIAYVEMNNFDKVLVVTPNSLKYNFYNEVLKFSNSKAHIVKGKRNIHTIEESKYIIFNYEWFNPSDFRKVEDKFKKLELNQIDCLICDECFTYDTLVDTNYGKLKIGDIVNNELNVKILSYNHKLKKIERKAIKRYLYRGYKNVVKVNFNDGTY
jgi:SNF2 family DNA or RNA helicase